MKIDGVIREVLDATEVVTVATMGDNGPHLVASWGDYMRMFGFEGDIILLPAGHFQETEDNLRRDGKIQLLAGSRRVQGSHSPGQGCILAGRGEVVTSGPLADKVKAKFPWARGALVIHVEDARTQL